MKRILPLLLLAAGSVCAVSCVSDGWDDYYDDPYADGYYDRRPPRHRRYDDDRPPRRPPPGRYDRDRGDRHDRDARRGDGPIAVPTPKGFVLAGSFQAGSAVECGIPTSKKIKKVRLVGTAGSVAVNTVVLREGSAKTPFPLSRRLAPGETAEIDLGGARQATGLRISAAGKGSYNVYVH